MGLIGCPKTLARNYHYSLHNSSEECCTQYVILFMIYTIIILNI